ncbi:MAG: thioredoxin peroxidase [Ignavibacteriae bacterium HGW-Ignavibacteriae-1]|jgi:peroxiredoxin (alkyl hydroperoxide reductase subunit C)|nr:MAG: thioredoxin peroxidase [Ignavibacteriae bacterium HGW-Ignavibacteriae-1]
MSLLVGKKAPDFRGKAVVGGNADSLTPDNAFVDIAIEDYQGKWVVFFFYPEDFTFVCPTEIEDFGIHYEKFKELNCEVIACSTDSHHSHFAWRSSHPSLKNLPYPMLADFTHKTATNYEVLKEETGYALRGLYIITPDGMLAYSVIQTEDVGRNTLEVLRVLEALQSGKKTPCNWNPGEKTLN